MGKTRAIRFSDGEEQMIEEFLRRNKIFDFSSMARTAITAFIERPKISIKSVKDIRSPRRKLEQRSSQ